MTTVLRSMSRRAAALFVALALVLGAAGCGGSDTSSATQLDVKDPKLVTLQETGERSFSGVLINNNSAELGIVQVEVALYDRAGSRIGTTTIEVEDVPANSEKSFSGPLDTDAAVAKARIRSLMVP
jgi:hypothetical protein